MRKPGSGRNSGGVCVFFKDWLMRANLIERIVPEMKDCVVLHFKSSEFLNMQDTVLYFAYVSPQGSTNYDNLSENNGILLLESNITDIKFQYPDSYFFLAGDLNAKTKDFSMISSLKMINSIFLEKQITSLMILICEEKIRMIYTTCHNVWYYVS